MDLSRPQFKQPERPFKNKADMLRTFVNIRAPKTPLDFIRTVCEVDPAFSLEIEFGRPKVTFAKDGSEFCEAVDCLK